MAQAVAIPIIAAVAAATVSAGAAALLAPKPTKAPAMTPLPTRSDAMNAALGSDSEFRNRKGAAASVLTGPNGAEAPSPGAKALLGQ